ncbi:deoxyuridine 5'-triphosphate nucleotidohydrolase-like [Populus trichocarpa]|uniref:deoxyuridine 5'-triphosphate nucleotidohydrolase-like n=1 Tax=Populus trichocarpa TaxID=3694 RepID=UPI000D189E59|nr:deoxyuridine 5'-triphosphate nucleotidohydrolase-like [Populus trichocarpa]|eukprot:XP_024441586.1 deoxyuridine 5'-triphosphate nucleotidohydrolase-like [Populus trichocarpa]
MLQQNGIHEAASIPSSLLKVKKLSESTLCSLNALCLPLAMISPVLHSASETGVPARGKALIPTDLSFAIPEGTYARIGLAWKHSIDVDASVIDADYRGPVGVNRSSKHSF